MTNRQYYTDPYNREFDATITRVDADGTRSRVRLDHTIFYPTSGGQPFDTGVLDNCRVVDVGDEDDGEVSHLVESERSALQVGQRVHGAIDWPRRFDHMQQHTGQHVLSAAFDHLFDDRTIGFHLGADAATIDLARGLTPRDLLAAETEANRVVWENRPVAVRFVSAGEAAQLPLRKESVRTGTLRLIEIEGFDLSACGGTHVARTGEIGLIALAAWERFKGGQRLTFHCGQRALNRLRSLRDTVVAGSRLLSIAGGELPEAIERLQGELKDQRRAVGALQSDLTRYRADELATTAETTGRGRLVLRALDADANGLKSLAAALTARGGLIAVLLSTTRPALVVVSRSADFDIASNDILTRLTSKFGGRGGGKPDLAQAGGLDAPADDILAEARRTILD
jgi:alanyl-tRNA synthetase